MYVDLTEEEAREITDALAEHVTELKNDEVLQPSLEQRVEQLEELRKKLEQATYGEESREFFRMH